MARRVGSGRPRGHIRQRGNSFQVLMYAGTDPVTGKELRLTESARTEAEAEKILTRFQSEVDAQRSARTKANLGTAIDAWLRIHEVEDNTRQGYEAYARKYIKPALGSVAIGKVTARVLEECAGTGSHRTRPPSPRSHASRHPSQTRRQSSRPAA